MNTSIKKIALQKTIILKAIAYAKDENNQIFTDSVKEFNEYSKKNNLDITFNDIGSSIENLLERKKNKYDLYFYENLFTPLYSPYLYNLKELLSEEHINLFNENILNQTCYYHNKLVALPFALRYTVLYSNQEILNKYNRSIPTTWDELIDTSQFIIEKEIIQNNNTDLVAYNGLFDDSEEGICSIYEFIYSCRKSINSPFPKLTGSASLNALHLMKKIKNEISSDKIFSSNEDFTIERLLDGNAIFLKYWFLFDREFKKNDVYKMSPLPGISQGVSGSTRSGVNIGIDRNIHVEKLDAAVEAFKFITSKKLHKKFLKDQRNMSGITSFYEDEDICININCDLIKKLQPITRITNMTWNFEKYYEKFRTNIYDYLYRDSEAKKILKNTEDLTKIYYISLDKNESFTGILIIAIVITLAFLMMLSLVCLFIKKFDFDFLPKGYWFISIIGLIFILMLCVVKLGRVTDLKCHLYTLFMTVGYTFNIVPILYKLIINFPENNKVSYWVNQHKYLFFVLFVFVDLILNGILFLLPHKIKIVNVIEGENFEKCRMNNMIGSLVTALLILYKVFIILVVLVLIFSEWCLEKTKFEIRFIVSTIYIDIICIIILLYMHFITIRSYISYLLIRIGIIIVIAISNYIFTYGFRLIVPLLKEKEKNILNGSTFNCIKSTQQYSGNKDSESGTMTNKSSVLSKLVSYHYKQSSNDSLSDSVYSKSVKTSIFSGNDQPVVRASTNLIICTNNDE
ncbi:hypothetical protein U3516DRAFT_815546 [Neocallimastix sp. 'constans']